MASKKMNLVVSLSTQGVDGATKQFTRFLDSIKSAHEFVKGLQGKQKELYESYERGLRLGTDAPRRGRNAWVGNLARTMDAVHPYTMSELASRYQRLSVGLNTPDKYVRSGRWATRLYHGSYTPGNDSYDDIIKRQNDLVAGRVLTTAFTAAFNKMKAPAVFKGSVVEGKDYAGRLSALRMTSLISKLEKFMFVGGMALGTYLSPAGRAAMQRNFANATKAWAKGLEEFTNKMQPVVKGFVTGFRVAGKALITPVKLLGNALSGVLKAGALTTLAGAGGVALLKGLVQKVTGRSFYELTNSAIGLGQRQTASSAMIGMEPTLNAFGSLREYSSRTGAELEPLIDSFQEALKYSRDTPAILEFERLIDRFARFTHRDLGPVMKSMLQLVSTGDVGRLSVTLGVPQTSLMSAELESAVLSKDFNKINVAMEKIAEASGITKKAFTDYVNSALNQIDRLKIVTKNLITDFLGYFSKSMGEFVRPLNDLLSSNAAQQFVSSLSIIASAFPNAFVKRIQGLSIAEGGVARVIDKINTFAVKFDSISYTVLAGLRYAANVLTGGALREIETTDLSDAGIEAIMQTSDSLADKIFSVIDDITRLINFMFNLPETVKEVSKFITSGLSNMKFLIAGVVRTITDVATLAMKVLGTFLGTKFEDVVDAAYKKGDYVYRVSSSQGAVEMEMDRSLIDAAANKLAGAFGMKTGDYLGLNRADKVWGKFYDLLMDTDTTNALMAVYSKYSSQVDPIKAVAKEDGKDSYFAVYEKSLDELTADVLSLAKYDEGFQSVLATMEKKNVDNGFGGGLGSLEYLRNPVDRIASKYAATDSKGEALDWLNSSLRGVLVERQRGMQDIAYKDMIAEAVVQAVTEASGGKYTSMEQVNTHDPEMIAIAKRSREIFENILKPQIIERIIQSGVDKSKAITTFDRIKEMLTGAEKFFAFRDLTEQRPLPVKPVGAVNIAKEDLVMLAELAQREYVSNFNAQIYAPAPVNTYNIESNANSLEGLATELRRANSMYPQNMGSYRNLQGRPNVIVTGGNA